MGMRKKINLFTEKSTHFCTRFELRDKYHYFVQKQFKLNLPQNC